MFDLDLKDDETDSLIRELIPYLPESKVQKITFAAARTDAGLFDDVSLLSNFSDLQDLTIMMSPFASGPSKDSGRYPESARDLWRDIRRLTLMTTGWHYPVFVRWMDSYKQAAIEEKSTGPALSLEYLNVNFPAQSDVLDFLRAFSTPTLTHLSIDINSLRSRSDSSPIVGCLAQCFPQLKELVLRDHGAEDVVRTMRHFWRVQ